MKIGNWRAPFIDYKNPGIFMITLNKIPEIPAFSSLVIKGYERHSNKPIIRCDYSLTGYAVYEALRHGFSDKIVNLQYSIMPDHLHVVIQVMEKMERPLWYYIDNLRPHSINMLKSGSQLCVRYGSEVEGVWRATRLRQRVIDDVKMRGRANFKFPTDEVLFNIRFNIS